MGYERGSREERVEGNIPTFHEKWVCWGAIFEADFAADPSHGKPRTLRMGFNSDADKGFRVMTSRSSKSSATLKSSKFTNPHLTCASLVSANESGGVRRSLLPASES